LKYAADLTRQCNATLHVVHVVDNLSAQISPLPPPVMDYGRLQVEMEMEARERLRDLLRRECPDIDARQLVLTSHLPATTLLNYARDAGIDLIVTGTHGRSGMSSLLLGSVAQKLVRSAPCPVLTTRAIEVGAPAPAAPTATTVA
jgi:nucleotide-binding universal stress UspA family protein